MPLPVPGFVANTFIPFTTSTLILNSPSLSPQNACRSVKIRMNVIVAGAPPQKDPEEDVNTGLSLSGRGGGGVNSIDDILSRVRSNRNRDSKTPLSPMRKRSQVLEGGVIGETENPRPVSQKSSTASDVLEKVRQRREMRKEKQMNNTTTN